MCGIAGVLNFDGREADPLKIKLMTDLIAHRGPDGEGCWVNGPVGLGHRRLSIIDISERASQPMESADGNSIITFNGEIYNYKELASLLESKKLPCKTSSDTEVIINLYQMYGTKCIDLLRGMFAFAIWDKKKKSLFLARDRVGIKPLYFLKNDSLFVFASEIKSISGGGYSKLKIDTKAFSQYLRFLVVPQPDTIFEDIHKLKPGHYIIVDYVKREIIAKAYWSLDDSLFCKNTKEDSDVISQFEALLEDSVRHHMVADVPVSAFLSGGLDSSAVVTMMRKVAPKHALSTFSTTFPGQKDFDESQYAETVAKLNKTQHFTSTINENYLDDYKKIVWHLDEPFAISSAYATYYLAKSASKKTKVVLTGDGGDELFAGYKGYINNTYLNNSTSEPFWAAAHSTLCAIGRILNLKGMNFKRVLAASRQRSGTEGLRYSDQVAQNSLYAISRVFDTEFFMHVIESWNDNLLAEHYDECVTGDTLSRKLYSEYKTRLVDEMLMKVDRMTMAHSLEARVPLLDHNLVEFAFGLSSEIKLKKTEQGFISKYILKEAMGNYLPKEIIYRKKQGFNIPVKKWIKGEFAKTIEMNLKEGQLLKNGIVSESGIDFLLNQQSNPNHSFNNMLMLLFAFETWAGVTKERVGNIIL